jgi:hypothetical protein
LDKKSSISKKGKNDVQKYHGPRTTRAFIAWMNNHVGLFRKQTAFPDEALGIEDKGRIQSNDPRYVSKTAKAERELLERQEEEEIDAMFGTKGSSRMQLSRKKERERKDEREKKILEKREDRVFRTYGGQTVDPDAGATPDVLTIILEPVERYMKLLQGERVLLYPPMPSGGQPSGDDDARMRELMEKMDTEEEDEAEDARKQLLQRMEELAVPLIRSDARRDLEDSIEKIRNKWVGDQYLSIFQQIEERLTELKQQVRQEMRDRKQKREDEGDFLNENGEEEEDEADLDDDFLKLPPLDLSWLREERDRLKLILDEGSLSTRQLGEITAKRNIHSIYLGLF